MSHRKTLNSQTTAARAGFYRADLRSAAVNTPVALVLALAASESAVRGWTLINHSSDAQLQLNSVGIPFSLTNPYSGSKCHRASSSSGLLVIRWQPHCLSFTNLANRAKLTRMLLDNGWCAGKTFRVKLGITVPSVWIVDCRLTGSFSRLFILDSELSPSLYLLGANCGSFSHISTTGLMSLPPVGFASITVTMLCFLGSVDTVYYYRNRNTCDRGPGEELRPLLGSWLVTF